MIAGWADELRRLRPWALLWLLLILAAAGYLGFRLYQGIDFRTDLLALLPQEEQDPVLHQVTDAIVQQAGERIILLVGHPDPERARQAATEIERDLAISDVLAFQNVGQKTGDISAFGKIYFPHRYQLLNDQDRQALLDGKAAALVERALAQVYSVGGFADSRLLATDPFLLLPSYLSNLPVPASRLALDHGWLSVTDGSVTWVLVSGKLLADPFAMEIQERVVSAIEEKSAVLVAATPDMRILKTGAIFFADAGSKTAMSETSTLGTISLIGTILLLLLVFRRATPLLLNTVTLLIGVTVALAGSVAIFGEIHVITLLFGVGLIGIAVDYGLHYSASLFDRDAGSPMQRLHHVLPGISLGLLTTLIGYVVLVLAPLPGLRQIAAFAVIGLGAAFLTVVFWFPLLEGGRPLTHGGFMLRLSGALWRFWENTRFRYMRWGIVAIACLCGFAGFLRLELNDDVRRMQSLSSDLLIEQAEIQRIAGASGGLQSILVLAPDDELALQREEALFPLLRKLKEAGVIAGFRAPANFVPSAARQNENARLVADLLLTPHEAGQRAQLGLPAVTAVEIPTPLTLETALASDAIPFLADMILAPGQHVIALDGVADAAMLRTSLSAAEGVAYIDPAGNFSDLLGKYRQRAVWLIALSAFLMLIPLCWRYGFRGALIVMAPPVLAVILAPALISLMGESLSFFNVMALVLVLSLGVDYAVFCAEATREKRQGTLLAVVIATLTTLLSFGMLAFSEVMAVHAFGLTLLLGVLIAFLLAPMAGDVEPLHRRLGKTEDVT